MAEPIFDEEEEEQPEPMDVSSSSSVDQEEEEEAAPVQPPKEKEEELMSKDEFINFVSSACTTNGNPYFLYFPGSGGSDNGGIFKGNVKQGTANALFVKMLCYFHEHRYGDIVHDDVVTFLFHLNKSTAFAVANPSPVLDERVRKLCAQFAENYTAENFLVAFMEGRAIRVFTGGGLAPYMPSFHLFYRISKAISRNGEGIFDKNLILEKSFETDGMADAVMRWSTHLHNTGLQPAHLAFDNAFKEFSSVDIIN
jgi:hypothetical protein